MLLLFLVPIILCSQIEDERVHSLPGVDISNSAIYSGYLQVKDTSRFMHYIFVLSEGNPQLDSVVLWLNGGPGCSSMEGMFSEIGPYTFLQTNSSMPQFNQNRWNRNANLLFLESPASVGSCFSMDKAKYPTYSDNSTAEDNYAVILAFYKKFSQFKTNPFWISGESYAGIYIPMLAQLIDQFNKTNNINLKGLLIGNGYHQQDKLAAAKFQAKRNQISQQLMDEITHQCQGSESIFLDCPRALEKFYKITKYLNPYGIYDYCWYAYPTQFNEKNKTEPSIPCSYIVNMEDFLNNDSVRKALNVSDKHWDLCTFNDSNYKRESNGSLPYINQLMGKYQILFYSGDSDAVVSELDTVRLLKELKLKSITKWHGYYSESLSQLIGFTQKFENKVTFATVRGAGHMVPADKRQQAFYLFNQTIHNKEL